MEFLPLGTIKKLIEIALKEDVGAGDVTTLAVVPAQAYAKAAFVARESMIVAGLPIVEIVFNLVSKRVKVSRVIDDGKEAAPGQIIAWVEGPARAILSAERVALNYLKRLCGIATLTKQFVKAVEGTGVTILDTRKTTPGWRILEKYAVRCGGAQNHRMGLYDMVVIKDNHLMAIKHAKPHPIVVAVRKARQKWPNLLIEVETENLEQVKWAIEAGADWIMLDNMPIDMIKEAVKIVNKQAKVEASGRVTLDTVRMIAETGVDYISVGALTHSARAVDIGLDFI